MGLLGMQRPPHAVAPPEAARTAGAGATLQARGEQLNRSPRVTGQAQLAEKLSAKAENRTGLPDRTKAGLEALSGLSMDHVRVHYNSPQPAQLNAHAFARGGDIHLAPGQEAHLPHEAWHVVQQAQGRVKASTQLQRGVAINDDPHLEHEADVMGARAAAGPVFDAAIGGQPRPVDWAGAKPAQLRPVQAEVTGRSHLVRLEGGGLASSDPAANEELEVNDGDEITIDDERVHVSRRGPNQETAAGGDLRSPAQYPWYHVLALGMRPVLSGRFVRADVVRVGGVTPKLTEQQHGMFNLPLAGVMAAQKTYQDQLERDGETPESLARTHRSVGFEFEFAKYGGRELQSHVVLAQSAVFSRLFDHKFVLETDSGSVLEIGFPPLLFRNRPGGGPNTPAISLIFNMAQTRMKEMGQAVGQSMAGLTKALEDAGFGTGWFLELAAQGLQTADRSSVKKLREHGVYSQLNITLTPGESAGVVNDMIRHGDRAAAETSAVGVLYDRIFTAMKGTSPWDAKTHMARAFANLAAAFDVARARYQLLPEGQEEDLSSTVKELHGVWIKDVPANVLAPFAPYIDPADVEAASSECEKHLDSVLNFIEAQQESVEDAVVALTSEVETCIARGEFKTMNTPDFEPVRKLSPDEEGKFREIVGRILTAMAEEEYSHFDIVNKELKPLLKKIRARALQTIPMVGKSIRRELNAMTAMFLAAAEHPAPARAVASQKTRFGDEQFGSGKGVRKDTHLPPVLGKEGEPVMSVAELRSAYVINRFLGNS